MAVSLAPDCFKVIPGKSGHDAPELHLTQQAIRELRAVYRCCTLRLHGYVRRTCIYLLNVRTVFRIPRIKLVHADGTYTTHVVRPDFLLPYHVHCAADCLAALEALKDGSSRAEPPDSLRPLGVSDEITDLCEPRVSSAVTSRLKRRSASTVLALERFCEDRHLEWHSGAVLKLNPGSVRIFRRLFPPRFLYFIYGSGKIRTAALWREGERNAPLRTSEKAWPPHAMTWPYFLPAHNGARPPSRG